MKTTTGILFAGVLIYACFVQAEERQSQKARPSNPAPQSASAVTVPRGATEVEPHLFRFTDAQGKNWMYRETPFGIAKWEETKAPAAPVARDSNPVRVTDLGSRVQFERDTPFGVSRWTRDKSELSDDEKALLKGAAPDTEKR